MIQRSLDAQAPGGEPHRVMQDIESMLQDHARLRDELADLDAEEALLLERARAYSGVAARNGLKLAIVIPSMIVGLLLTPIAPAPGLVVILIACLVLAGLERAVEPPSTFELRQRRRSIRRRLRESR